MGTMHNAQDRNTHGHHISRGVLRALAHAQGQLSRNHREGILFMAIDTLGAIKDDPLGAELASECPAAFETERRLRPLADDAQKRRALFAWDMNVALKDCAAALKDIAYAACLRAAGAQRPGQFRNLYELAGSAANYIDMAQDLHSSPLTGSFVNVSKINPYVCASFTAAYMGALATRLERQTKTGKNDVYGALAAGLREQCSKIRNNLPESLRPVHEIAPGQIRHLYNIMSNLSQAADQARHLGTSLGRLGTGDGRLAQATKYLFATAAVYDWEQFETNARGEDFPARGNVFRLVAKP